MILPFSVIAAALELIMDLSYIAIDPQNHTKKQWVAHDPARIVEKKIEKANFARIFLLVNQEPPNVKAIREIGFFYDKGQGVRKNPYTAFKWFKKAAKLNDVKAMRMVGLSYMEGRGVPQNINKAII